MMGFHLEFERGYDPSANPQKKEIFEIEHIGSGRVHDWTGDKCIDSTPRSDLEVIASQIPPPRKSENFMAPVNEVRIKHGDWVYIANGYRRQIEGARSGPRISSVDLSLLSIWTALLRRLFSLNGIRPPMGSWAYKADERRLIYCNKPSGRYKYSFLP